MKRVAIVVIVLVCSLLGVYVFSVEPQREFVSDGCTLFPDGVLGREIVSCCWVHDQQYFVGGSYAERIDSDRQLGRCVADKTYPVLGWLMQTGVRFTGSPYVPTYFRWGFRDPYGTFYEK